MIYLNILKFTKSYCLMLIVMSIAVGIISSCSRKNKVGSSQTTTTLTLKVQKKGNGSITASWNGGSATETQLTTGVKIPQGTKVTLTAKPSSDNAYVLWNNITKSKTYQMTMDKDNSVTVSIVYQYLLTVSKTGKGIVTASWTGGSATDAQLSAGALVDENTAITLTATPDASMPNVVWNGNITGNTLPLTITANQQVSVAFSATPPTLFALDIMQPLITDGTITAYSDATFTIPITDLTKIVKDAKVYIKVVPATGKKVTQLIGIDAGSTNSDNTEAVVTMTANKTISATIDFDYTGFVFTETATEATLKQYTGALTSITIPSTYNGKPVTVIGSVSSPVFNSSVTGVIIPNSVTTIDNRAFYRCSGLKNVNIPSTVTTIGSMAFAFCDRLTSITIPSSVINFGNNAFENCTGLQNITLLNNVIGQAGFAYCTGLTSITIPNNIKSIRQAAFLGCSALTNVTIPSSVTSIGQSTFLDCSKLTDITVDIANANYYSNNGVLFVKASNTIIAFPAGKAGAYIIPNGVTSIGNEAFRDCGNLTSVIIPNSVTSIGGSVFSGCSELASVVIGNGITSIGDKAFAACTGLTSVTMQGTTPPTLGSDAFYNTASTLKIYVPILKLDTYKGAPGWSYYSSRIYNY